MYLNVLIAMTLDSLGVYMAKLWRLWAKALGEKSGSTDAEADRIACVRTVIVLVYVITNCFIMAGVIRHW